MSEGGESKTELVHGLSSPVGTRRTFFQWVIAAATGVIGLGLAGPLAGYLVSPALKRREQPWVEVGRVGDLKAGEPTQLDYVRTVHDGWMENRLHKAVWAIKQPDGQVVVFSPMCPHLGCGYRWDGGEHKFKCPCHGSVYAPDGAVLGGPAPRHLDVLPSKIEGGKLFVIYKEFKSGLREAVEL